MNRNDFLIEADELLTKVGDPNLRIYDASVSDGPYLQKHIPEAAFFDHGKFSDPDNPYDYMLLPETGLAAQIGNLGIGENSEVIFYACGMLPFAARAWWMLRYAGHNKVRVLNGGLSAWEKAGGAIEREPRTYAPCVFKGRIRPDMFASREDVLAALQSTEISTVNVLPLESFEASHIPGSTCLPCLDLMENMESFLPDDQLAQRLNGLAQSKRIITYCGAGIAAAVNAMALLMIGHGNVAVYDGSLYEWLGEGLPVTGTGKWEVWKM